MSAVLTLAVEGAIVELAERGIVPIFYFERGKGHVVSDTGLSEPRADGSHHHRPLGLSLCRLVVEDLCKGRFPWRIVLTYAGATRELRHVPRCRIRTMASTEREERRLGLRAVVHSWSVEDASALGFGAGGDACDGYGPGAGEASGTDA